MNHITTLEVNEETIVVSIDFENHFGQIEIEKITNIETGDAIAPDLWSEIQAEMIYNELHEFSAEFESVETENNYRNV